MLSLRLGVLAFLLISEGNTARILGFFPCPARSHQIIYKALLYGLAERGHQVTYVTPFNATDAPKGITQIQTSSFHQQLLDYISRNSFDVSAPLRTSINLCDLSVQLGETTYSDPNVQKLIHSSEKYDLILLSSSFLNEASAAFQHKFNAPAIDVVPTGDVTWMYDLNGGPVTPSYILDFKTPATNKMDFFERLRSLYTTSVTLSVAYYCATTKLQWQTDKYFNYTGWEMRPRLTRLLANKSLVLTNSHFTTNYPIPLAANIKEIGGIHISPRNALPQNFQKIMDSAFEGVIYFSLGSHIQTTKFLGTNESLFRAFADSFASVKQTVLWKWDQETMKNKPANVVISKWFPQREILAHKNCKVFITHGGYLSLIESVNSGVPLIGIPFYNDQEKNMKHATSNGYGITVFQNNITKETVSWALLELLNNPAYKIEATRRSKIYRDKRWSALEEAIYWVEFVLRHGDVLRSGAAELSWFQLNMIDLWAFGVVIVTTVYWCISTIVSFLRRQLRWNKRIQSLKPQKNLKSD